VNVADMLAGKRVCICAGSGGVGKTTVAAAVAMGMAARGLKVAVITIDPAKRLANSLGLEELDNTPRLVEPGRFAKCGLELRG
jgi:anion-transporting  ArsA/GET3 family ATPase